MSVPYNHKIFDSSLFGGIPSIQDIIMYSQNKTDNILNEIKITDEQHMENTSFTARTTTKTTSKITTKTSIKKKDAKHSFVKLSDGGNLGTSITNENELPNSIKKKENMFVTLKETEENFFSEHEAMTNTKSFERNDSEMDGIQLDSIEKDDVVTLNKKPKLKKNKKTSLDKQNISMKSSFTKFDALQKRNLTNNLDNENESTCHICQKPVYKMEEIKAEKFKYHKTCFRCTECNKQLKVDNYQSHEGAPFCIVHFKQLFSPKCVEDNEPTQAQKPELIIRENQPEQLPSDVVKASIKSDLGLEELQQLNLRAKFQVFENNNQQQKLTDNKKEQNNVVKSSRSISERKAQLQENNLAVSEGCVTESYKDSGSDHNSDDDDFTDLKDGYSHEQLSCNGKALSALKKNFESGSKLSKEERREERKQEIQNIRSRLFMGKQARIKEMYQQAVAESEKGNGVCV
ncbi:LIM domain and actin-binding protein 1-like [Teleopsis dalmanni]|uniref:LIM domain and actin-binding protein 1-like n=1 Tax=Teleopsis dalmanni TaxID=139649 RepID=UPI0018CD65D4|nr:LIM domain and actin-binding protein 1-like [Teleopsis dalmanni]